MKSNPTAAPRLAPIEPPYTDEVERSLQTWMGRRPTDIPPLRIFRVMHRDRDLARAIFPTGRYILGEGKLERRHRELLILRTCARCGAEYEWGVHAAVYPAKVGLTGEQVALTSTLEPGGRSPAFEAADAWLLAAADELHDHAVVSDATWAGLAEHLDEDQLLELLLVCGWYHFISYLARSAGVELEPWQARFPEKAVR